MANLFGFNEARHTKDRSRRFRFLGLALAWLIVLGLLVGYVIMTTSGYLRLGIAEVVPTYLFVLTSLPMLFFTYLKAGSIIFQMKSYDMTISLPVSGAAVVISRFLVMYITNFLIGLVVIVPGFAVYGIKVQPGLSFYAFGLLGALLLPLLPLTIATAVSAGTMALTARMRSRNIVSTALMILILLLFCFGSMGMGGQEEFTSDAMLLSIADLMNHQLAGLYPPAGWFQSMVLHGAGKEFLYLFAASVGPFVILMILLQHKFLSVCTALNATSAKNNYRMQELTANSLVKALWKREAKRYFASSIYVMNTLIAYIMMAGVAAALFFLGAERVEAEIGLPGIVQNFMPMVLSMAAVVMPITSVSVSMEGKTRWQLQTLPVRGREIWKAKILWNLSVALPFYLVAVVLSILALKPVWIDAVWMILLPAVYILFSSVAALSINIAVPIFDWDNETRVVKQSASAMFSMLTCIASVALPILCLIFRPQIPRNLVYVVTVFILLIATCFLNWRNAGKEL